jgi:hypothetical protein
VTVKLDLSGVKQLRRQLEKVAASEVDVGFLDGKAHPAEPPGGLNLPSIALIQEFGAPEANIPPRPFMSETFRTSKAFKFAAAKLRMIFRGMNTDVRHSLFYLLGKFVAGEMSRNIKDWSEPANAPFTVDKKGFNDPLVETGFMRDNVDIRVKPK